MGGAMVSRTVGGLIMRDLERISKVLKLVEAVWRRSPDMRLGQLLVVAAAYHNRGEVGRDLFGIKDEELVAGLERLSGEFSEVPEEPGDEGEGAEQAAGQQRPTRKRSIKRKRF